MTDFNIKAIGRPITRDELKIISFNELLERKISPGFIFYVSSETGKPFVLLNPGDPIENEFVEKYQNKGMRSFFILETINLNLVNYFKSLFEHLSEAKSEEDFYTLKIKILKVFKDIYWDGKTEGSVLDLVIGMSSIFNKLDPKIATQIKEVGHVLYTRSLCISSLAVIVALIDDVTDFKMLQDIYHTALLMDYGLIDSNYTFMTGMACEEERIRPGTGLGFLSTRTRNPLEVTLFKDHPQKSIEKIVKDLKGIIHNQDLLKIIARHHEVNSGLGFPVGLYEDEIRSMESIPIFVDSLITFNGIKFKEKDGKSWFKKLVKDSFTNKRLEVPVKKLLKKLESKWDFIEKEGNDLAA